MDVLGRGVEDGDAIVEREADRPDGERELLGRRGRRRVDAVAKCGTAEGERAPTFGVLAERSHSKLSRKEA
jgi:hypothetical protein